MANTHAVSLIGFNNWTGSMNNCAVTLLGFTSVMTASGVGNSYGQKIDKFSNTGFSGSEGYVRIYFTSTGSGKCDHHGEADVFFRFGSTAHGLNGSVGSIVVTLFGATTIADGNFVGVNSGDFSVGFVAKASGHQSGINDTVLQYKRGY